MQGEGEDEENDMFSTNRKFNPNDLVYSGTVSLTLTLAPAPALALALAPTISGLLGHGEPRIRASDPLSASPLSPPATHYLPPSRSPTSPPAPPSLFLSPTLSSLHTPHCKEPPALLADL